MTGILADGFDWMPTGQSAATVERLLTAAGYYINRDAGGGTPSVTSPGRFGFGRALRINGVTSVTTGGYAVICPLDPEVALTAQTGFVGFGLYMASAGPPASYQWIGLFDAVNNAPQMTMHLGPNGVLRAYRGYPSGGTLLGVSAAGALLFDGWSRVEIGAKIANSGGTFEIRVNTRPVISLIALDTQNTGVAAFDAVGFGCQGEGATAGRLFDFSVDCLTVNDDQGAQNNTWLGNVRVKTQFAAGVGDLTQFTATGAATNWQAVLNTLLDDTKYVAGATVGLEDLYAMEAILGAQAVHFLQLRAGMRQTDATQRIARLALKMGGVQVTGRDHYLNQTFAMYRDIKELDPFTGVGIVGTDLNAGQTGPIVQA